MKQLVINPGSTSTKLAVFENELEIFGIELNYQREELVAFMSIFDQFEYRFEGVEKALTHASVELTAMDFFVGRGGVLPPVKGGTYTISKDMLEDTAAGKFGEHACSLGAHIANRYAEKYGKPCFVVDPPSTDEMEQIAKVTGLPGVERRFLTHALSQRGIGRIAATELGKDYLGSRLLVAHLGGGISVGAHNNGQIVDAVCAYHGEGPFTPERCGAIPALSILDLIDQGEDPKALRKKLTQASGLWAHIGTTDLREVEEKSKTDKEYAFLLDAMAYNIAKSIAALAPVLFDEEFTAPVDAIVLTGGMVKCGPLLQGITKRVSWIAPVRLYPKTCEMQALATGALRVMQGVEDSREYVSPLNK